MDWSFRQNWDEFSWAKEIRKDELRIAGYFRALPGCLDLPGEDEIIFKSLMAQPELVPTGVKDPHAMKREFERDMEDTDWEEERKEARRSNAFESAKRVEKLASEWILLAASGVSEQAAAEVLKVVCAFGKLLARLYNFEETEVAEDTLALRISLLKRSLGDINDLLQAIGEFKKLDLLPAGRLDEFFNPLSFVREAVLDRMNILRNGKNNE